MEDYGYRKLKVWLASKELVKAVYLKLQSFPREEQYALCDQLRRAVISIPSNIAEGYGRDSHKDFAHFIGNAKGSLFEVATQLELAVDLGYMNADEALDDLIGQISRMLAVLRTRLLTTDTPTPHTCSHFASQSSLRSGDTTALRTSHSS